MIRNIKREFLRQFQEMMQFKFNLFFANLSILIMASSYLAYFKGVQDKFTLFCLLLTWYFASHSITHPTFFVEDDIYDRTIISIIQSRKRIIHVLFFKMLVQILIDTVKALPIFIALSFINPINFPTSLLQMALCFGGCFVTVLALYGLGFFFSSFCLILNRTSNVTSLISYFMLFFTGILQPFKGLLGLVGSIFPFYALRNYIAHPTVREGVILILYGLIYWGIGLICFECLENVAKKKGTLFHV